MSFFALVAAAAALQSVRALPAEILGVDVPHGFRIGNHQRNEKAEIVELVAPPETVDDWSRLITELSFFRGARVGPESFYARWVNAMRNACPELEEKSLHGTIDGHNAIRGDLSCPFNQQTRKPENPTVFLVQGDVDLLMAQVAFRRPVTLADTSLINHIAGSLKLCERTHMDLCSARKRSGFRPNP